MKRRIGRTGTPHTSETKQKMSVARRKAWRRKSYRARQERAKKKPGVKAAYRRGGRRGGAVMRRPEHRERIRSLAKKKWRLEKANPKDLIGVKKSPLRLVPPALEIFAAPAMAVGARKYGVMNWRHNPVLYSIYLEAIKRHLDALLDGEDFGVDKQTGAVIHHGSSIAANIGIIADAMYLGNLIDDRPPAGPAPKMLEEQDTSV